MAKTLKKMGHKVSFLALGEGPMRAAFARADMREARWPYGHFDLYFANTVLSVSTALKLSPSPDRVIAWIHECWRFLEIAQLSAEQLRLPELKYVAFPTNTQMGEFRIVMPDAHFFLLRNCVKKFPFDEANNGAPYLVVVGYWEENKNQTLIVDLMNRLEIKANLVFVGAERPPHISDPNYKFLGHVPNEKSREIISQSSGLLSASLSEVQGLSAIEALLCRRPVLLNDVPGHRELQSLIPNIRLFDLSDPDSFASGLAGLDKQMANESLRDDLQSCTAKYFNEEIFMQSLENLIAEVVPAASKRAPWPFARVSSKSS